MQCTNTANDMLIIKDFKYLRTTVLKQGKINIFTQSTVTDEFVCEPYI